MRGVRAWTVCESPLGSLTLVAGEGGLAALHYEGAAPELPERLRLPAALARATAQLEEYFAGERRRFEVALDLAGTALERRVWRELQAIPFGRTVSYTELAQAVGRADVVRAVAGAVARTPVPIVVPCHRVIGADGALRGYIGGLERKAALLQMEHRASGLHREPAAGQLELL